jgi:hydrogenase-4 membrane subunit HyfE
MANPLDFFGTVDPPDPIKRYGATIEEQGLVNFANNLLKLVIAGAGIFAFVNIIIAGYSFLGAGGDPKKIEQAWARIWQSLLGLLFVAGSFVLAAIFGWLIFGNAGAIISPKVYGPPGS